jgi:uncharacterized DUF497 family protein/predicted DNA binding CopG/RHH family protein
VFSWDARKALSNLKKHAVSFEEAATVFGDPDALDWDDTEHSHAELRSKRLGTSVTGRILLVIYTPRSRTMPRKSSASSARARQLARNAKPMSDSKLNLFDIPESTDAELRRARRVGRPATGNAKQLIAIRIAPQLLRQLRRLAAKQSKPYQTLIHELLEKSARKLA